jgi:hypothetical protein
MKPAQRVDGTERVFERMIRDHDVHALGLDLRGGADGRQAARARSLSSDCVDLNSDLPARGELLEKRAGAASEVDHVRRPDLALESVSIEAATELTDRPLVIEIGFGGSAAVGRAHAFGVLLGLVHLLRRPYPARLPERLGGHSRSAVEKLAFSGTTG